MEKAASLVFPGAILGSIVVGFLGFFITAGVSYPGIASSPAAENIAFVDVNNHNSRTLVQSPEIKCEVSRQFPKSVSKWCATITKYAKQYHLPPDLIAAMVWQESGGNPKAYSSSGAVGLMQIMPSDGIAASFMCSGGACFANRPSMAQLMDPEFNIKYGARMLAGLVKKHGGYREALKAYGPMDSGYYYADKVLSIYKRYGN
ncbi:MAG: lytic transglycosylase domain-containing protein [Chloroflexi bacterium]|nr:lytic transglycosylase domain-containing protein [Chloroflexota bacterium]